MPQDVTASNESKPLLHDYSVSLPDVSSTLDAYQSVYDSLGIPINLSSLYTNTSKFFMDVINLPDVNQRIAVLNSVKIPFLNVSKELREYLLSAQSKEHAAVINGLFGNYGDVMNTRRYRNGNPSKVGDVSNSKMAERYVEELKKMKISLTDTKKAFDKQSTNAGKLYSDTNKNLHETRKAVDNTLSDKASLPSSHSKMSAVTTYAGTNIQVSPIEADKNAIHSIIDKDKTGVTNLYTSHQTSYNLFNRKVEIIDNQIDQLIDLYQKVADGKEVNIGQVNKLSKALNVNLKHLNAYTKELETKYSHLNNTFFASSVQLDAISYLQNNPEKKNIFTDKGIPVDHIGMYYNNPLLSKFLNDIANDKSGKGKVFYDNIKKLDESFFKAYNALYFNWNNGEDYSIVMDGKNAGANKLLPLITELYDNKQKLKNSFSTDKVYELLLPYTQGKDLNGHELDEPSQNMLNVIKEHYNEPYLYLKRNVLFGDIEEKEQQRLSTIGGFWGDFFENVGKTAAYSFTNLFGVSLFPGSEEYLRYEMPIVMSKYASTSKYNEWKQKMLEIGQGVGFIGGAVAQMFALQGFGSALSLLSKTKIASSINLSRLFGSSSEAMKASELLDKAKVAMVTGVEGAKGSYGARLLKMITPFDETITYLSNYGLKNPAALAKVFVKGDLLSTFAVVNESFMERSFVGNEMEDRKYILKNLSTTYGQLANGLIIDPMDALYIQKIMDGTIDDDIRSAKMETLLGNMVVISSFNKISHIGMVNRLLKNQSKFGFRKVMTKKGITTFKAAHFRNLFLRPMGSAAMISNIGEGLQEIAQDYVDEMAKRTSVYLDPYNINNNNVHLPASVAASLRFLKGDDGGWMGRHAEAFKELNEDYLTDVEHGAFNTFFTTFVAGMIVNGLVGMPVNGYRYSRFLKRLNNINSFIRENNEALSGKKAIEEGKPIKGFFTIGLHPLKMMKGKMSIEGVQDATASYPYIEDIDKIIESDPFIDNVSYDDFMWLIDNADSQTLKGMAREHEELAKSIEESIDSPESTDNPLYYFHKMVGLWYYHTAMVDKDRAEKVTNHLVTQFLKNHVPGVSNVKDVKDIINKLPTEKAEQINHAAKEVLRDMAREFRYRAQVLTKTRTQMLEELLEEFKDNEFVHGLLSKFKDPAITIPFSDMDDKTKMAVLNLVKLDEQVLGSSLSAKEVQEALNYIKENQEALINESRQNIHNKVQGDEQMSSNGKQLVLHILDGYITSREVYDAILDKNQHNVEQKAKGKEADSEATEGLQQKLKETRDKTIHSLWNDIISLYEGIGSDFEDKMTSYREGYKTLIDLDKALALYENLVNVKYIRDNILENIEQMESRKAAGSVELFKTREGKTLTSDTLLNGLDKKALLQDIINHLIETIDAQITDVKIRRGDAIRPLMELIGTLKNTIDKESLYVRYKEEASGTEAVSVTPQGIAELHEVMQQIIDLLDGGFFIPGTGNLKEEIYRSLYWMSLATEGVYDMLYGGITNRLLDKMKDTEAGKELFDILATYDKIKVKLESVSGTIKSIQDTIRQLREEMDKSTDAEEKKQKNIEIYEHNIRLRKQVFDVLKVLNAVFGTEFGESNPYWNLLFDEGWMANLESEQDRLQAQDLVIKTYELLIERLFVSMGLGETSILRDKQQRQLYEKELYSIDNAMSDVLGHLLMYYEVANPQQASTLRDNLSSVGMLGLGYFVAEATNIQPFVDKIHSIIERLQGISQQELVVLFSKYIEDRVGSSARETLNQLHHKLDDSSQQLLELFNIANEQYKYRELVNKYDLEMQNLLGNRSVFEQIYNRAVFEASLINPVAGAGLSFSWLSEVLDKTIKDLSNQRRLEQVLEGIGLDEAAIISARLKPEVIQKSLHDFISALQELQNYLKSLPELNKEVLLNAIERLMISYDDFVGKLPYNQRLSFVMNAMSINNALLQLVDGVSLAKEERQLVNEKQKLLQIINDYLSVFKKIEDIEKASPLPNVAVQKGKPLPIEDLENPALPNEVIQKGKPFHTNARKGKLLPNEDVSGKGDKDNKGPVDDRAEIIWRHVQVAIQGITRKGEVKDLDTEDIHKIAQYVDNVMARNKNNNSGIYTVANRIVKSKKPDTHEEQLLEIIRHLLASADKKAIDAYFVSLDKREKKNALVVAVLRAFALWNLQSPGQQANPPKSSGKPKKSTQPKETLPTPSEDNNNPQPTVPPHSAVNLTFGYKYEEEHKVFIDVLRGKIQELQASGILSSKMKAAKKAVDIALKSTSEKGIRDQQYYVIANDVKRLVEDLSLYFVYLMDHANLSNWREEWKTYRAIYELVFNYIRVNKGISKEEKQELLDRLLPITYYYTTMLASGRGRNLLHEKASQDGNSYMTYLYNMLSLAFGISDIWKDRYYDFAVAAIQWYNALEDTARDKEGLLDILLDVAAERNLYAFGDSKQDLLRQYDVMAVVEAVRSQLLSDKDMDEEAKAFYDGLLRKIEAIGKVIVNAIHKTASSEYVLTNFKTFNNYHVSDDVETRSQRAKDILSKAIDRIKKQEPAHSLFVVVDKLNKSLGRIRKGEEANSLFIQDTDLKKQTHELLKALYNRVKPLEDAGALAEDDVQLLRDLEQTMTIYRDKLVPSRKSETLNLPKEQKSSVVSEKSTVPKDSSAPKKSSTQGKESKDIIKESVDVKKNIKDLFRLIENRTKNTGMKEIATILKGELSGMEDNKKQYLYNLIIDALSGKDISIFKSMTERYKDMEHYADIRKYNSYFQDIDNLLKCKR